MPKASWELCSVSSHATLNAIHAVMPGFEKFKRLPSDKQQISRILNNAPTENLEVVSMPHQSNPNLALKVPDWRTWAYTDGSCQSRTGKQETGAGVYHPLTDRRIHVEPNGAGITNNVNRAELAGITAAITHNHAHIGTDSLISSCLPSFLPSFLPIANYQADKANNSVADTEIPVQALPETLFHKYFD